MLTEDEEWFIKVAGIDRKKKIFISLEDMIGLELEKSEDPEFKKSLERILAAVR